MDVIPTERDHEKRDEWKHDAQCLVTQVLASPPCLFNMRATSNKRKSMT